MFKKLENKNLCEQILMDLTERNMIKIPELGFVPDYIYMLATIPPNMSISQTFHLLKGASAYTLFKKIPSFRKRYPKGLFWSPGKFYRSVDNADFETVIKYVQDQRLIQTTLVDRLVGC